MLIKIMLPQRWRQRKKTKQMP